MYYYNPGILQEKMQKLRWTWDFKWFQLNAPLAIIDQTHRDVGLIFSTHDDIDGAKSRARTMRAAPELLRASVMLMNELYETENGGLFLKDGVQLSVNRDVISDVHAAIQKAW